MGLASDMAEYLVDKHTLRNSDNESCLPKLEGFFPGHQGTACMFELPIPFL